MVRPEELMGQDWEISLHDFDNDEAWETANHQVRNIYVGSAAFYKRDPEGKVTETHSFKGRIRFQHDPQRFVVLDHSKHPVYVPEEGEEPSVSSRFMPDPDYVS